MRSTTYYHAIPAAEQKSFADLEPKIRQLDEACTALPALINQAISPDGMKADRNVTLNNKIKDKCDLEMAIQEAMGKADRKKYRAWSNDADWSKYTPVSDGQHVWAAFWGGNKGIGANVVTCFDLEGKRVYAKPLDSLNPRLTWVFAVGICSSTALGGRHLFVHDDQGQTLILEPGPQYKVIARNLLVEYNNDGIQPETQSNFFFEGERIYFRTRGLMYCIGQK